MQKPKLFLFLFLLCCSCATVFNKPDQLIELRTNEPTQLIVATDTLSVKSTQHFFYAQRKNDMLPITIIGDSLQKDIALRPRNSFAYLSNFFYPSFNFLGALIVDRNSNRRYGYPTLVSVDLENITSNYFEYGAFTPTKQLIKVTPLKLIGFTNASFELAYERPTGKDFSTQVMASILLPTSIFASQADPSPNTNGYRFALEERFYFKKEAPFGPYFAIEFDLLKKQFYTRRSFVSPVDGKTPFDYYEEEGYEDTFLAKTSFNSLNFKYGYQKEYGKLFLDFYFGIGFRSFNTVHEGRINHEDVLLPYRHFDFSYNQLKEGKHNGFSFPLNLRLGWRF